MKPLVHVPMESVSVDLCEYGSKKYMVMVDRHSGYPFVAQLRSTVTSAVTKVLEDWFLDYGWPKVIGSDGGPQFRSEFDNFCKENHIIHELSSVAHPQSNGLAEAGVKQIKALLEKTSSWQEFKKALLHYRNIPSAAGGLSSPAQRFFGRVQRRGLPSLPVEYPEERKEEREQPQHRELPKLYEGQKVRLQHPVSRRWTCKGIVVRCRMNGRSYVVKRMDGRYTVRNRRYLKPMSTLIQPAAVNQEDHKHEQECEPRRRGRIRHRVVHFQ
jgi:hypothetical protein